MALTNKITSWSFSRWQVYDQCPLRAKFKFIDKIQEPGSPQMDRGTEIHLGISNYLKGASPRLTKEQNPAVFGDLMRGIRAKYRRDPTSVYVEDTWAYRADWSETTWNDWNGCWLRVKIDAAVVAGDEQHITVAIDDWKTGKFNNYKLAEYELQMDLYALSALTRYKHAKDITVTPSLRYIDAGITHAPRVYEKKDHAPLKKEWEKRVKPMLNDTTFAAKPSTMCKYCSYSSANGGRCKF